MALQRHLQQSHRIRSARAGEAGKLTALARTLKASWGYPDEMLEAFRAEMTVPEAAIVDDTVAVCVSGDEVLGFYAAMGFTRFGQSPSGSIPGRYLPLLEMTL